MYDRSPGLTFSNGRNVDQNIKMLILKLNDLCMNATLYNHTATKKVEGSSMSMHI